MFGLTISTHPRPSPRCSAPAPREPSTSGPGRWCARAATESSQRTSVAPAPPARSTRPSHAAGPYRQAPAPPPCRRPAATRRLPLVEIMLNSSSCPIPPANLCASTHHAHQGKEQRFTGDKRVIAGHASEPHRKAREFNGKKKRITRWSRYNTKVSTRAGIVFVAMSSGYLAWVLKSLHDESDPP